MTYEKLSKFVTLLRHIQIQDDNNVNLGVTGRLGCGKSSLTIDIAREYVRRYFGEERFDVEKYIAYNNKDIIEKIHSLPPYSPLIADEAIRIVWSRDWNKMENKELAKLSTQIRTKKLIFFMNIPRLQWIDSMFRTGLLDIWIWVHANLSPEGKESYALVFEPDENQGEPDQWHMSTFRKYSKSKRNRIGRFTDIERLFKMVKNHPCFMDSFKFPKVPKELYERYLLIRNKRAFESTDQYINQKDAAKILIYNIKHNWIKLNNTIRESRVKRPTNKIISEILAYDPIRKKTMINSGTIQKWFTEMYGIIPEGEPNKEEKKDEEQKDKDKPDTANESNLGIVKSALALPSKPEQQPTTSDL